MSMKPPKVFLEKISDEHSFPQCHIFEQRHWYNQEPVNDKTKMGRKTWGGVLDLTPAFDTHLHSDGSIQPPLSVGFS